MHKITSLERLKMVEENMTIDEAIKGKFKQVVHQVGAQHGAKGLAILQRRESTRKFLDERVDRPNHLPVSNGRFSIPCMCPPELAELLKAERALLHAAGGSSNN